MDLKTETITDLLDQVLEMLTHLKISHHPFNIAQYYELAVDLFTEIIPRCSFYTSEVVSRVGKSCEVSKSCSVHLLL